MSSVRTWDPTLAQNIIDEHSGLEGPLLPILHALQNEFGYIDTRADELLAHALNISQAEVRGRISFYHDFERAPTAPHHIKICRAEACQSMGCEDLVTHITQHHKIGIDDAQHNGSIVFKTVYCLGNCALGPSLMVHDQVIGRAHTSMIDQLINNADQLSDHPELLDEILS